MKAIFLSGASPINNESSTFLYRLLLKAWSGTRPYRCKQITVGKEARTVSCLWGLWNARFDNGAGVVEPAWQRLALVIHCPALFPLYSITCQAHCSSPSVLLYPATKFMAWFPFSESFEGGSVWEPLVSVNLRKESNDTCVSHTGWLIDEGISFNLSLL